MRLRERAYFAGHNTHVDLTQWARSQGIAEPGAGERYEDVMIEVEGRSVLEAYALRQGPELVKAGLSDELRPSEGVSVEKDAGGADAMLFGVDLRASDSSLVYSVAASSDLVSWAESFLRFSDGGWSASSEDFSIRSARYVGDGYWNVLIAYDAPDGDSVFYRMAVN